MMKSAVFPGTFDPFTVGHLDVLRSAVPLFDRIYIGVYDISGEIRVSSLNKRCDSIREIVDTEKFKNIIVSNIDGSLVDYCRREHVHYIIRGLRNVSDFEYGFQMNALYRQLFPDLELLLFMPTSENTFISPSIVREIERYGKEIDSFLSD